MVKIVKPNNLFHLVLVLGIFATTVTHAQLNTSPVRVAATVNGEAITTVELDNALASFGQDIKKKTGASETELRAKVLDKLIDEKILEQSMTRLKIEANEREVDDYINRMRDSMGLTPEQFDEKLKTEGTNIAILREQVSLNKKRQKFINEVVSSRVNIPERELRTYFNKNINDFRNPKSADLAQITIPFTKDIRPDQFEQLQNVAISLAKEAQTTSDFKKLAEKYNGKPFVVQGGNFGIVNIEDLQPRIAQVVKQLGVGQSSQPIPTNAGINIVKVLDRPKISEKDFALVRDEIYDAMYGSRLENALEDYIKQERKNALVEIKSLGTI